MPRACTAGVGFVQQWHWLVSLALWTWAVYGFLLLLRDAWLRVLKGCVARLAARGRCCRHSFWIEAWQRSWSGDARRSASGRVGCASSVPASANARFRVDLGVALSEADAQAGIELVLRQWSSMVPSLLEWLDGFAPGVPGRASSYLILPVGIEAGHVELYTRFIQRSWPGLRVLVGSAGNGICAEGAMPHIRMSEFRAATICSDNAMELVMECKVGDEG